MISVPSNHSVDETVKNVRNRSQPRSREGGDEDASYQIAQIRQSESRNAADAGSSVDCHRPATEILVWEDGQGKVWLTYNSPEYLQQRHDLPRDLV